MAEKSLKTRSNWHPASIFGRFKKFYTDQKGEIKKIVWPSKKQVINNTNIVLAVVIVSAIMVGSFDWVLSQIVNLVLGSA